MRYRPPQEVSKLANVKTGVNKCEVSYSLRTQEEFKMFSKRQSSTPESSVDRTRGSSNRKVIKVFLALDQGSISATTRPFGFHVQGKNNSQSEEDRAVFLAMRNSQDQSQTMASTPVPGFYWRLSPPRIERCSQDGLPTPMLTIVRVIGSKLGYAQALCILY